ncbi:hypothetical protein LMG23994_01809 [Cupriavidus pinatubonensis]|uniref:Uncharacterized protein n=1 Tax=Cupriavidus pinatubonensis TaxID=248026 RepID=A0ABN7YDV3_9BURK|nr:hypothetical protein LMG23994_01809 [Cupriavidus pinatubonensis]
MADVRMFVMHDTMIHDQDLTKRYRPGGNFHDHPDRSTGIPPRRR